MGFSLGGRLNSILCVALAGWHVAVAACCNGLARRFFGGVLLFPAVLIPLLSCMRYILLGCKRFPDLL